MDPRFRVDDVQSGLLRPYGLAMTIRELQTIFEADCVKTDPQSLQTYGCDWTTAFTPNPSAIVFPKSNEQIIELIKFANLNHLALVPSGGRTGLSGGAVATNGEIVVSMEKMQKILAFNPIERTVTCQAGVITENLQNYAQQHDLFYPINLASRGSCQIGGNIATNAGGLHVIRYGATREWVRGLTVITGKGELLELNRGLIKNATGYDLRHLFIGSEGTLGIIVEAILGLTTPSMSCSVMLLSVNELQHALTLLQELQKQNLMLTAFEFFSSNALQHVIAHTGMQPPFAEQTPFYVLIEFENPDETTLNKALSIFEQGLSEGWVNDGVVSQSEEQAKSLWKLRENITASIAQFKPFKNDLSVAIAKLPDFIAALEKTARNSHFELVLFGHLGDGNMHVNILKPVELSIPVFLEKCIPINEQIFQLIRNYGGSISAEHGVGLLKKPYLHFSCINAEIAYMQGIKRVFDPNNILNPGKIF